MLNCNRPSLFFFFFLSYTERKKKRRVNFIPKFHSSLKKFVKYFTMITKHYMYMWFWVFSRYFVPLTPPTVFVRSFWNFTGVLRMVWRCACGFFQNPEIIFYHFFRIFNVGIFWVLILQKSIVSRYLVPLTPPTVFGGSFWNFTWAFRMAWRYACGFFRILK